MCSVSLNDYVVAVIYKKLILDPNYECINITQNIFFIETRENNEFWDCRDDNGFIYLVTMYKW